MKHLFLTICSIILLASCSANLEPEWTQESQEYIFLPENTDFSNLSRDQLKIIYSAASRFAIQKDEDGLFWTPIEAPDQIKVSPNIFEFFMNLIDNSNQILLNEEIRVRNNLLSRSPEDDPNYFRNIDCLAWSIAAALPNCSYENVSSYLYNHYPNGQINISQGGEAMAAFGTVTYYQYPYPSSWDYNMPSNNVVIIANPDGTYHAVSGMCLESSNIYVMDYQQGTISQGENAIYDSNRIYMIVTITPFQ